MRRRVCCPLDDSITITNTFRSIVDSSAYLLDVRRLRFITLQRLGQRASVRELIELMETVSSNLPPTLIGAVDAKRANRPHTPLRRFDSGAAAGSRRQGLSPPA